LVVAWSRVILGFLGVVNWGSVSGSVIFGLFGVVLRFGEVARCSVGCSVVNWRLGVVFRFNVVRRSSRCVVSRGCVILGRLSCVAWGRIVLGCFGVVSWGSVRSSVVLRCLGGVVLGSLGVVIWSSVGCSIVLGRFGVFYSRFGGGIS
jgi:hypothetical protein